MNFPIADAHCDFLYGAMEYGYDINTLRRRENRSARRRWESSYGPPFWFFLLPLFLFRQREKAAEKEKLRKKMGAVP